MADSFDLSALPRLSAGFSVDNSETPREKSETPRELSALPRPGGGFSADKSDGTGRR
jgi:hypothetical protein